MPTTIFKITKSWLRACQEWARLALIWLVMSSYVARESGVMPGLHRITSPLRPVRGRRGVKLYQILELLVDKRHARDTSSYTRLGDQEEQSYAYKINLTYIRKCYSFIENVTAKAMPRAIRSLL